MQYIENRPLGQFKLIPGGEYFSLYRIYIH